MRGKAGEEKNSVGVRLRMTCLPYLLGVSAFHPTRLVSDHSSVAHEAVTQHIHLHARSRFAVLPSQPRSPLQLCVVLMMQRAAMTGGLDAPFNLFFFFLIFTF